LISDINWAQVAVLILEAAVIACGVLALFRLRPWFGITILCVLLAVMQPIQAIFAAEIYLEIAQGIFIPPASVVLFSSGLLAVLVVYLREDASAVRTVIYSLVIGNLLVFVIFLAIGEHVASDGREHSELLFGNALAQPARTLLGGTAILVFDVLVLIPVYEFIGRLMPRAVFWRIYLTLALVLILDAVFFSLLAFFGTSLFFSSLQSGVLGKVIVALPFAALLVLYLRYIEPESIVLSHLRGQKMRDVFEALSYRQRYELQRAVAEEALEELAALHNDLLDATTDALLALDAEYRIVDANSKAGAVLDRPQQTLMGHRLVELVVSAELESQLAPHTPRADGSFSVTATASRVPLEASYTSRSGEHRQLEVWLTPVRSSHTSVRVLVAIRDVSDRQRVFAQHLHTTRMESLGRLAGGVAHDFNNLLMVIMNSAELMEESGLERARVIREAAERGTRLTRQLLAFARSEASKPDIVDVNDMLAELEEILSRVVRDDVNLVLNLSEGLPPVWMSRDQLEQVIINLVGNARDAMVGEGTITLSTSVATQEALRNTGLTGRFCCISVTDDGEGIPPEDIEQIFDPFFTTKKVGEGTGLGLSMALGVAEQAGGTVLVQSVQGQGSTFHVLLPETFHKRSTPELSDEAPRRKRQKGKRILVVDDDATVAAVVEEMLIRSGYQASVVYSAHEAIEVSSIVSQPFDLVITDIVMPEMRGDQLAKVLREKNRDILVVFMTGHATGVAMDMTTLGEHRLLHKPFQVKDLLDLIDEVLDV
jgi:PAS domain S-box-containing protein